MRLVGTVLVLGALAALPAQAQSKTGQVGAAPAAQAPAPDAPSLIPANGVDAPPRQGFYVEAALGIFTTFGGDAGISNGQPYLSMAVGRTVGSDAALFLSLGIGASSSNCFDDTASGNCFAADSFAATYFEVGGSYGGEVASRLRLSGKLVVGMTQLSPSPVHDSTQTAGTANYVPGSLFGPHAGLGVTLDYDTHLDHFAVGLDLTGRFTLASRPDSGSFGLFSIAFMPRVRYVF